MKSIHPVTLTTAPQNIITSLSSFVIEPIVDYNILRPVGYVKKGLAMTDDERMFGLEITLGAIIELCEYTQTDRLATLSRGADPSEIEPIYMAINTAVNTLCRINGLDPHALHQRYIDWQNGMDYIEGEHYE